MTEHLLSVSEAARLLGISGDRVRQLCDSGALPSHRDESGLRRIPRSAIEDRLRGQRGRRGMLVATRTFRVVVDGQRQTITAGKSYIDPGHEIVKRFPDRFSDPREHQGQTPAKKSRVPSNAARSSDVPLWFVGPNEPEPLDVAKWRAS
jgi:excisionase family DNA binding protein